MPASVTARSDTQLKTLPAAAPGFSTASDSMLDRSRTCATLVSCIPFPGIGTGRFRTILSKNHSSQSLLLPEPIMYCGRNDAQQLPNCSAMYFSTPTWPALSFTASPSTCGGSSVGL
uniref:Uncharacterized protein n=1 Tax=Zea mays TaxID=4577 RepID=C4J4A5_MAIZE|nr:unknown [Zea mays]